MEPLPSSGWPTTLMVAVEAAQATADATASTATTASTSSNVFLFVMCI